MNKYYKISDYSFARAKEINVRLKPSLKGNYKIDIFNNMGDYITSIGHRQYADYPTYLKNNGKEFADSRRDLYYKRHKNYKKFSRGWYASKILW